MQIKVIRSKNLFAITLDIEELLKDIYIAIGHSEYLELRKHPYRKYKKVYYEWFLKKLSEADVYGEWIKKMQKENAYIISEKDGEVLLKYLKDNKYLLMDYDIARGNSIEEFIITRELNKDNGMSLT